MVKLSLKTKQHLKDDIVSVLYDKSPRSLFAFTIALELRRDKEFVKGLLIELESLGIVERMAKNARGQPYTRRVKWRIPFHVLKAMPQKK